MIILEKTSVMNFDNAVRGARNPMNSWNRSDSYLDEKGNFVFGSNDLDLAMRLCRAGSDHRKFLRMIFVSVDITAPLYWWKEFDTYKVGTVANSCSTMHKLHSKAFERADFSMDKLSEASREVMDSLLAYLEELRLHYLETKDKSTWYNLIQMLPSSYNQMRTVTLNYENLRGMYFSRKDHKLEEWHVLCDWIRSASVREALICGKEKN